ncbi:MAG: hypothetical protein HC926_00040 [Synechococcaceae cyanobacterium SM2_3_60]|nr:hypothetical protein [Synechococcaceae cyanobacterium SM2_3_60]
MIWWPDETVEYRRYPDNHLDRQLERFQKPPNTLQEPLTMTEKQLEQHKADVMAQHTRHLHHKFEEHYNIDRLIALGSEAHVRAIASRPFTISAVVLSSIPASRWRAITSALPTAI